MNRKYSKLWEFLTQQNKSQAQTELDPVSECCKEGTLFIPNKYGSQRLHEC